MGVSGLGHTRVITVVYKSAQLGQCQEYRAEIQYLAFVPLLFWPSMRGHRMKLTSSMSLFSASTASQANSRSSPVTRASLSGFESCTDRVGICNVKDWQKLWSDLAVLNHSIHSILGAFETFQERLQSASSRHAMRCSMKRHLVHGG